MAVPDTNTFALTDVITELGLPLNAGTSLADCFTASVDASFDNTYKGSKDRLSNFRNYGAIPVSKLGYLYNLYTIAQLNFAPSGWHVPTKTELELLVATLGGSSIAGGKLKDNSLTWWDLPNIGATNESGMSVFGSGLRQFSGAFAYDKVQGFIPSITTTDSLSYWILWLGSEVGSATVKDGDVINRTGLPVRLIKDDSVSPSTVTDYDGNFYDTVKIGSQVWTTSNWKCTKLNNGTLIPTVTDGTAWNGAYNSLAKCAYDNDESNV